MIDKKYLRMAAESVAMDHHQQSIMGTGHTARAVIHHPGASAGGWLAKFQCCHFAVDLLDSDVVIRALVLRALEAE